MSNLYCLASLQAATGCEFDVANYLGLRELAAWQTTHRAAYDALAGAELWAQAATVEAPKVKVEEALLVRLQRRKTLHCMWLLSRTTIATGTRVKLSSMADVERLTRQLASATEGVGEHVGAGGLFGRVLVGYFDFAIGKTSIFKLGATDGELHLKLQLRGQDVYVGTRRCRGREGVAWAAGPLQGTAVSVSKHFSLMYRSLDLTADCTLRKAEHGMWAAHGGSGAPGQAGRVAKTLCVLCLKDGTPTLPGNHVAQALQLEPSAALL
eukprot:TRINITY_DN32992_c0_g1_i1.p1 TRINITY_DN32992_c0_g1~~TRINITY_DN32992_c0_g1_i1.p1  ORF type:complete len:267 (+),score=46.31 TRINITY_DN32992_c0_g1_i1:57-857(+)